jgi:hypothetical protein
VNGGSLEPTWIAFLRSKAAMMSAFALRIESLSSTGRVLIQSKMLVYCSLRDIVAVLEMCWFWLARVMRGLRKQTRFL